MGRLHCLYSRYLKHRHSKSCQYPILNQSKLSSLFLSFVCLLSFSVLLLFFSLVFLSFASSYFFSRCSLSITKASAPDIARGSFCLKVCTVFCWRFRGLKVIKNTRHTGRNYYSPLWKSDSPLNFSKRLSHWRSNGNSSPPGRQVVVALGGEMHRRYSGKGGGIVSLISCDFHL